MTHRAGIARRAVVRGMALAGGSLALPRALQAQAVTAEAMRVAVPYGVQVGDLSGDPPSCGAGPTGRRGCGCGGPRPRVCDDARTAAPHALEDTDFTGKLELTGLPAGQTHLLRVRFLSWRTSRATACRYAAASARRPPAGRNVRFVWSGDTVGQGWGINPDFGGMTHLPDDAAVGPTSSSTRATRSMPTGRSWPRRRRRRRIWRGRTASLAQPVTEAKAKVGGDAGRVPRQLRLQPDGRAPARVQRRGADAGPVGRPRGHQQLVLAAAQGERPRRYREPSVAVLAARGMRAFHEYMPTRRHPLEPERIYASFR